MATEQEKKKPTLEEYLKEGKIKQSLYDAVELIPKPDKKARVIETLHRRIERRGTLGDPVQIEAKKKQ